MITVNSTSGGRSSNYMTVKYPADINLFSCVTIEDERYAPKDKGLLRDIRYKLPNFIASVEEDLTLKNLIDIEEKYGVEIIWTSGDTFEEVIRIHGRGILPSAFVRYCTTWLKIVPIFAYLYSRDYASDEFPCLMNIGIRADEVYRKEKLSRNNKKGLKIPVYKSLEGAQQYRWDTFHYRELSFPLIDAGITSRDVFDFWQKEGFMYPIQSNCVGCFHKSLPGIQDQFRSKRSKLNWFIDQEDKKEGKSTWINGISYRQIKELASSTPTLFDYETAIQQQRSFPCNCTD